MPYIFWTLSLLFHHFGNETTPPPFDFDAAWKKVEEFRAQGQPKSALAQVHEILVAAKTEHQTVHWVKAVKVKSELILETEENGMTLVLDLMKAESADAEEPARQVLYSYIAELLSGYYAENRYKISQRTRISSGENEDFETWDSQKFHEVILKYYTKSLQGDPLNSPIKEWEPLLVKQEVYQEDIRPTLRLLLWDRMQRYLQDARGQIQLSLNGSYVIRDAKFLGTESDLHSLAFKETRYEDDPLYQLLRGYSHVTNPTHNPSETSRADYFLSYLEFVHDNGQIEGKDSLYILALEQYIEKYNKLPYVTMAYYKLGNQYFQKGKPVIALDWFKKGAAVYPDSPGNVSCRQGALTVLQKEANLNTEEVFSKEEKPRFAIDYKNIDKVNIRILKIDNKNLRTQKYDGKERYEILTQGSQKVYEKLWQLPVSNLYQTNFMEGTLSVLPYGTYLLEIKGPQSSDYSSLHNYAIFHVSDLASVSWREGNTILYKVTDRMSGKPVKKALVTMSVMQYDYQENNDKVVSEMTKKTNKDGVVSFDIRAQQRVNVVLQQGDDVLDTHAYRYFHKENKNDQTRYFAEVFTDRGIYRPGQILHCKAIAIQSPGDARFEVMAHTQVDVVLLDANYQEVEKKSLKTNEFGSVATSFTLPSGRLTGDYHLQVKNKKGVYGQKYFKVEEYKRPTFEIIPDTFRSAYKLNQEVKAGGKVVNYAGNALDGAMVRYKVVRGVRFIDWGWWWRPGPVHNGNEVVVAQGETMTDTEGQYALVFKAAPDESADREAWTVFDYRIEIIAIDHTGESQEAKYSLSVGYTSENMETDLPPSFDIGSIQSFNIFKKNLQGLPLSGSGKILVEKLREPEHWKPHAYWNRDNRPLLNDGSEGIKILPIHDVSRFDTWLVEKKTAEQNFNTQEPVTKNVFPKGGVYKMTLQSKDAFGVDISRVFYHVITDFENKDFPLVDPVQVQIPQKSVESGQSLEVKIGVAEKPVYVALLIESRDEIVYRQHFKIQNTFDFQYPVKEEDRGGIFVHVIYVYKNRSFTQRIPVVVPYTNKQLEIEWETFRDNITPGAQETFSFVVKGSKKDAVAAELMATMFDASLESFVTNTWEAQWYNQRYSRIYFDIAGFQMMGNSIVNQDWNEQGYIGTGYYFIPALEGIYLYQVQTEFYYDAADKNVVLSRSKRSGAPEEAPAMMESAREDGPADKAIVEETEQAINTGTPPPAPRKNMNELVFFYPQLQTDASGNVKFTFTMNEALTKWKMMVLAHTPDLKAGYQEWMIRTHKKIMVFPNTPRFVRNGDKITLTAKVVNQEQESLQAEVAIKITETLTGEDITARFIHHEVQQKAELLPTTSKGFAWEMSVPEDYTGNITWTVWAKAGGHSDGEENVVPVLTNRQLITETMPVYVNGHQEKAVVFSAFEKNNSPTRKDHLFSVEYTSHPIWYAIQALPYLTEQGYETTEQIVNRYFANALAAKIANSHPKIKAVFDQWKNVEPDAFTSKLASNPELKSALLEETPWVLQSMQVETQKRNLAMLFESNQLSHELKQTLEKLRERQLPNGAFPWCVQGRPDLYTSQYILESIGQMSALGVINIQEAGLTEMVNKIFAYVDSATLEAYNKNKTGSTGKIDHLYALHIHYVYLRTLFPDQPLPEANRAMYDDFYALAKKDWLKQNLYSQAIIGLIMHHHHDILANQIAKSLEERSFTNDETGKYWNTGNGYRWDELPIERQGKIIEFYTAMGLPSEKIVPLKIWLLKNKQSRHWSTSKSTAAAIYALLWEGNTGKITHWVEENQPVTMYMNGEKVEFTKAGTGSGYVKKSWQNQTFPKTWAQLKVNNPNSSVSWGAMYYQYFEDIQHVQALVDNPLKISKKMFLVTATDQGESLEEINEKTVLKPGDRLAVILRIKSDRSMDYVHLKDGRPSGTEPIETLSGYRYNGGLGYYENIKDLASHFYFQHLPKGDFTLEYRVKVVHRGLYSAGLATLQSMYAPEFSSHSQGFSLDVRQTK